MVELKEIVDQSELANPNCPMITGVPESNGEDQEEDLMDFSGSDDEEDLDESDRELQVAFQKGYLKPGLNLVQPVIKKSWINNASGLKAKLGEFSKKDDFDWLERLDVTVDRPRDLEKAATNENDFKREVSFIKQAQAAVSEALLKLRKLNVVTKRPDDYFAEMFKSDDHMKKVRHKLLAIQQMKEKSEAARRFREEKKFAARIQKDVALERQKEKKMLSDAVKKHKKGIKDQLENMIGDRSKNTSHKSKRALKDQKYGHGGQKKRSKWNTAQSSADFSSFDPQKFSKTSRPFNDNNNKRPGGFKRGGGKSGRASKSGNKKQRPGKQRRKTMQTKKKNRNH